MRTVGLVALCGAAVVAAASAAVAQVPPFTPVILYDYIYYSDASKTVEVGYHQGVCYGGHYTPVWAGVAEFPVGTVTPYYDMVVVGRCTAGGGTIYQ